MHASHRFFRLFTRIIDILSYRNRILSNTCLKYSQLTSDVWLWLVYDVEES